MDSQGRPRSSSPGLALAYKVVFGIASERRNQLGGYGRSWQPRPRFAPSGQSGQQGENLESGLKETLAESGPESLPAAQGRQVLALRFARISAFHAEAKVRDRIAEGPPLALSGGSVDVRAFLESALAARKFLG